jgi:hypothetical protein
VHGVVTVRNYSVLLPMRCLYDLRLSRVAIARGAENVGAHQGAGRVGADLRRAVGACRAMRDAASGVGGAGPGTAGQL